MRKGFNITFNIKNRNTPKLQLKFFGDVQEVGNFDFGNGEDPHLKCATCGVTHWIDSDYKTHLASPKERRINLICH